MKFKLKVSKTSLLEVMAEFFGTFVLLLALYLSSLILRGNEPLLVALVYIFVIVTFGVFSKGHFNPLFTFAHLFTRLIEAYKDKETMTKELKTAGMYLLAQLLAAFAAYLVVIRIQGAVIDYQIVKAGMELSQATKDQVLAQVEYANIFPAASWKLAFFIEAVFSFVVALVYLINSFTKQSKTTIAMAIGLTFFVIEVFANDISGSSFHFIKSFVAAVFKGGEAWSGLGVYVLAGLVGALMAALVYVAFDKLQKPVKK
jgi:glycerol uptake facilitator-like aquaporin